MRRNLSKFLVFVPFVWIFSVSVQAAPETYTLDPQHSFVVWQANHFGFSHPSGKWPAEGSLILDKDKPQDSKANITIRIADIVTGIPKLNEHLIGKQFFDVSKFPTATFVSNKVDVINNTTAKVQGMLTIRDIAKPVTLDVTLNKADINPITNKPTAGFTAKTTLKRSDFGITTLLPGVGDEVKIDIETEAFKNANS